MDSQNNRVNSFQEDLQTVQDQYLPQPFEEAENFQDSDVVMYSPQYFQGAQQQMQQMQYSEEQRGLKRRRSDSTNLSLGSGSSDEPDWMREQLLEDAEQPLPNINISSADLPDTENVNYPLMGGMPPVAQEANRRGDTSQWVYTTQNQLGSQMQNNMNAPPLQATNIDQQITHDSATRIPELPNVPCSHELELSVGYHELTSINKRVINQKDGFLLFHEKTPPYDQLPTECQFVPFPNLPSPEEGVISKKYLKYIERILTNLQGGLQIRCHENCIYATRRSKAKIFYRTHFMHPNTDELPRNHEVMIFNGKEYFRIAFDKYLKQENSEQTAKCLNPTIYFTFAQKWFPDATPLKSMLVWAKIVPHMSRYYWDAFFHAKENFQLKSLSSMNSDLIQVSNDPTTEEVMDIGRN